MKKKEGGSRGWTYFIVAFRVEIRNKIKDNNCAPSPGGGMADAKDSKSFEGNLMWVRLPPRAP